MTRGAPNFGLAGVQGQDIPVFDQRQAVGGGGEVVEQRNLADAESILQRAGRELPGQVGQLGFPAIGRPGDTKTGGGNVRLVGDEVGEQVVESRGSPGWRSAGGEMMLEAPVVDLGQCQQGLGAAEIAAEDHVRRPPGRRCAGAGRSRRGGSPRT